MFFVHVSSSICMLLILVAFLFAALLFHVLFYSFTSNDGHFANKREPTAWLQFDSTYY